MSLFKFGFTSHSDKDNEEEKQKADRKQNKNMKKKSENVVFFPNGKMILNGLRVHTKRDQHLLFFCYQIQRNPLIGNDHLSDEKLLLSNHCYYQHFHFRHEDNKKLALNRK